MGTLKFDKNEVITLVSALKKDSKVMLVGDHGVYLMSFTQPVPRVIVYAQGCNPHIDEDFYDTKHDVFGGDDGADEIGTAESLLRIASVSTKWVIVKLSATKITIQQDVATPIAPVKVDASLLPAALRRLVK